MQAFLTRWLIFLNFRRMNSATSNIRRIWLHIKAQGVFQAYPLACFGAMPVFLSKPIDVGGRDNPFSR
ncbi:MAG: hypothetical protein EA399_01240 [Desulfovibrionales bacterium]|nr:MAG: hypothetical protein EA399_01240 [Desulfovibrionales bacterium]